MTAMAATADFATASHPVRAVVIISAALDESVGVTDAVRSAISASVAEAVAAVDAVGSVAALVLHEGVSAYDSVTVASIGTAAAEGLIAEDAFGPTTIGALLAEGATVYDAVVIDGEVISLTRCNQIRATYQDRVILVRHRGRTIVVNPCH